MIFFLILNYKDINFDYGFYEQVIKERGKISSNQEFEMEPSEVEKKI